MVNAAPGPWADNSPQVWAGFARSMMTGSARVPAILIVPPAPARMEKPLVTWTIVPGCIVRVMLFGTMRFEATTIMPMFRVQVVFCVSVPPTYIVGCSRLPLATLDHGETPEEFSAR